MLSRREVFGAAALPFVPAATLAAPKPGKEYRKARVAHVIGGTCACTFEDMIVSFDVRGKRRVIRRALRKDAEIELEIVRYDLRWGVTGLYKDGKRLPIEAGHGAHLASVTVY